MIYLYILNNNRDVHIYIYLYIKAILYHIRTSSFVKAHK